MLNSPCLPRDEHGFVSNRTHVCPCSAFLGKIEAWLTKEELTVGGRKADFVLRGGCARPSDRCAAPCHAQNANVYQTRLTTRHKDRRQVCMVSGFAVEDPGWLLNRYVYVG